MKAMIEQEMSLVRTLMHECITGLKNGEISQSAGRQHAVYARVLIDSCRVEMQAERLKMVMAKPVNGVEIEELPAPSASQRRPPSRELPKRRLQR